MERKSCYILQEKKLREQKSGKNEKNGQYCGPKLCCQNHGQFRTIAAREQLQGEDNPFVVKNRTKFCFYIFHKGRTR